MKGLLDQINQLIPFLFITYPWRPGYQNSTQRTTSQWIFYEKKEKRELFLPLLFNPLVNIEVDAAVEMERSGKNRQ